MKCSSPARTSGILLHLTSLPGRYGIGDLGPAAYRFADALAQAKQTWWQILPITPPAVDGCPYQCFSAMAGDPNLISPDLLLKERLISRDDLATSDFRGEVIDFPRVTEFKRKILAAAWARFPKRGQKLAAEFDSFRRAERSWLREFSLFMALKEAYGGVEWVRWPRDLAFHKPDAVRSARSELADAIARHEFIQFLFFRQLATFRKYAGALGIRLIGDLPIFVSGDSADVWSNPAQFQLDRDRRPKFVSGVPPDYFSATGQRWGNPLYNWSAMRRDGFRWWIARMRMALRQADLIRIDHFRGFAGCWTIPASSPTAQRGRWVKAPGREIFDAVHARIGRLPFIAEDLGVITPDVEKLRDDLALPGMRVLQFAFGGGAGNPFLPHHYPRNCIAYTGTHDNDTTVGWYKSLDPGARAHLNRYSPSAEKAPSHALIRLAWSSVAEIAIAPLQDVFALGSDSRMNTPGTTRGNWSWRMRETMLSDDRLDFLREVTETYGRNSKGR